MHPLSESAARILDRMEPDCRYELEDLRAFIPGASVESLREIMHELWVSRQVERDADFGWRRHLSMPPHVSDRVSRDIQPVEPEGVFDDAALTDFFK